MLNKTKIEWADYTWNPITGCLNNCSYCYGRRFAKRFGKDAYEKCYLPTLHYDRLKVKFPKQHAIIFANSMSDPQFWTDIYKSLVIEIIVAHPEHTFVLLTKGGFEVYRSMDLPANVIAGVTATNISNMPIAHGYKTMFAQSKCKWLLNIEPLHGDLSGYDRHISAYFDWLIIGAETGKSNSKIIPKWEWIEGIVLEFDLFSIPVFIKPSMKDITPIHMYRQDIPNVK